METRKELFETGYKELNIRKIAKACHAAVGTVYNYFPSKDILIAHVVLEDWVHTTVKIQNNIAKSDNVMDGLRDIYRSILEFHNMYRQIFEESSVFSVSVSFMERHTILRNQIVGYIEQVLHKFEISTFPFFPIFLAENYLTGSNEEWTFDDLAPIIKKLLNC